MRGDLIYLYTDNQNRTRLAVRSPLTDIKTLLRYYMTASVSSNGVNRLRCIYFNNFNIPCKWKITPKKFFVYFNFAFFHLHQMLYFCLELDTTI